MSATKRGDFAFEPKVWEGHVSAYFDRKMAIGQMAVRNKTLTAAPGETVNFPYFKKIGDAEEPNEDSGLEVDKLQDDSFSCTVKEVAKAVGIKKSAYMKSAEDRARIDSEVQKQIAQVMAEKVDKDIITEINTSGNYTDGYIGTTDTHVAKIANIAEGKILAFGDKQDQSVAIFMHSLHFLDLLTDSTAGFLKADANDPFWGAPGFIGRLLGMALFTLDTMPAGAALNGKKSYYCFIMKAEPFGIIQKQAPEMERDYDMLAREWLFAGSEWYGVKAFHGKVSADDKRISRHLFATRVNA